MITTNISYNDYGKMLAQPNGANWFEKFTGAHQFRWNEVTGELITLEPGKGGLLLHTPEERLTDTENELVLVAAQYAWAKAVDDNNAEKAGQLLVAIAKLNARQSTVTPTQV